MGGESVCKRRRGDMGGGRNVYGAGPEDLKVSVLSTDPDLIPSAKSLKLIS